MYKFGALCYRDCNKKGMVNCGIGACAANTAACISGIINMAVQFLVSLAQFVTFVASFGATSGDAQAVGQAKGFLANAFNSMKSQISNAFEMIKRIATDAVVRGKFIEAVLTKAAILAGTTVVNATLKSVCQKVGEGIFGQVKAKSQPALNANNLDVFSSLKAQFSSCANPSTENLRIACAQVILNAISLVDPSGLTGMASALVQKTCDV